MTTGDVALFMSDRPRTLDLIALEINVFAFADVCELGARATVPSPRGDRRIGIGDGLDDFV